MHLTPDVETDVFGDSAGADAWSQTSPSFTNHRDLLELTSVAVSSYRGYPGTTSMQTRAEDDITPQANMLFRGAAVRLRADLVAVCGDPLTNYQEEVIVDSSHH